MGNIFNSLPVFLFAVMTAFSNGAFHQSSHVQPPLPSVTISPSSIQGGQNKAVYAHGSLSAYGQSVDVSLNFPENGGAVSGTVSGACHGSLQGNYSGGSTGTLTGEAHATCPVLWGSVDGSAPFNAKVTLPNNTMDVHFSVSAPGINQSSTTTFSLSE